MNHIYKRILSASLSLVLVGSLSYGTAGAVGQRQDFAPLTGTYTTGEKVPLKYSMLYAQQEGAKLYSAFYDGNQMTSLQLLPPLGSSLTLSGNGKYQIFCLNQDWAPAEISKCRLSVDAMYGSTGVVANLDYRIHDNLGPVIDQLMSNPSDLNQPSAVFSAGVQQFLTSLQRSGSLGPDGKIPSAITPDNWNKIFDHFAGYVLTGDPYYSMFKQTLSFNEFFYSDGTTGTNGTNYYLRCGADPQNPAAFNMTACVNYLAPKFRDLVLSGYDVMINSAPVNHNEAALIDRIATILESRLTGVTAYASGLIQGNGATTPVTLTKDKFIALAQRLRENRVGTNGVVDGDRTIEIISVLQALGADRLDIQHTIDAAYIIQLLNVTDITTQQKLNELFRSFPSRTLHMILDFDTVLPTPQQ